MHLPKNFSGLIERQEEFIVLFKQFIEIFKPYYGFVQHDRNWLSDNGFWLDGKPTFVHWLNYYDETTAQTIGLDLVLSIKGVERFENGYFFMLQDEPLDVGDPQHMQRQSELNELLGLKL